MPLNKDIHKVLIIGSGPIIIGQAAEFDYAGNQACKALKAQGLEVVLVNSNPATLMTDHSMADEIYIEPLNVETIQKIILKEKPDSLLSTLGGQTGLTLSMELAKSGFLKEHGVKLLGANPETIDKAEDRQIFKDTMEKIGEPCIPSKVVTNYDDALDFAKNVIGFPAIIRPAFTLGGTGGGIAYNEREFDEIAHNGLHRSPIHQILVEKCISGWKEVEFEVMRDSAGNVITVCSMENFDPVGVHTGDSIVIAPTVTLSDKEYQMLRSAALNIISELKIEGGCNCQFALNPDSFEYAVIEVNPRVSRSSALASKATGYPIAKVAALIAIKYFNLYKNETEAKQVIANINEELKNSDNPITEIDEQIQGHKVVGIIKIPKIELEYPILETTSKETLNLSITKFWGNQINEIGNVTLAGHNNLNGTMFGKTKKLEVGDVIELTDIQNVTLKYKVFKIYVIDPNDISCILPEQEGTREVTLITCTNGNKNRLIVKAREENL